MRIAVQPNHVLCMWEESCQIYSMLKDGGFMWCGGNLCFHLQTRDMKDYSYVLPSEKGSPRK